MDVLLNRIFVIKNFKKLEFKLATFEIYVFYIKYFFTLCLKVFSDVARHTKNFMLKFSPVRIV